MGQRGTNCRPVDRRGKLADELVRTLTGADADAVRDVIDDPAKLQLVVARKTGNFKRGNERR